MATLEIIKTQDIQELRPLSRTISLPFNRHASITPQNKKPYQWFVKRTIDVCAASLGLLCISPLLLLVVLAIKLESKGPALFSQKRVGMYGKEFEMFKFRSMKQDAEDELDKLIEKNEVKDGMFKIKKDPRVTQVGRFIRKYSIDELPQLLNVIKGDMSLVGPRPPLKRELQHYKTWHYVRFSSLPGLTGLWQVSGRSSIKEFDKVVSLDYEYIKNWDLNMDIKILLKTPYAVIFPGDSAC